MPLSITSMVASRAIRLVVAVVLIASSVWAFAPWISYRISSSAFVNAELTRITAPIAGQLSSELPAKGQFISQPLKVMLVKSYTSDRRRLFDLERQHVEANEKIKLTTQQLAEIATLDRELQQRTRAHRDGIVKRLNHEIAEANAEKAGCLAEVLHRRDIGARMKGLVQAGNTSQIRSAEALAQQEATATKCEMAAARLGRLRAELTSVENGVFVRDATNDVPYSQQQRERLFLRRQELEMDAHQQRSRIAQLAPEIEEERRRVDQLGQFNVTLPAHHVVWSVPVSVGSAVTEGQAVLDLADCNHRFVAVELPEREFEQIKSGDPAWVRLIGGEQWHQGQVRQVRGSAAHGDDRLLAARVPVATPGHITVEVSIPDDKTLADAARGYCGIGRLAEVRFQRRAPALIERAERLLSSLVDTWSSSRDKLASD
jgi:biotin carboxyl carrier protein